MGAKYKIYIFPLEYLIFFFFAWKDNHIEPNFLIFNASDICGCKNIKFPYEFFWKHFKSRPNPMHNVKLLPSFLVMLWKCIFWSLWFFLYLFYNWMWFCSSMKMICACVFWTEIHWVMGKVSYIQDAVYIFLLGMASFCFMFASSCGLKFMS